MSNHLPRRLIGRDPHEPHRAATPLELFYDLTFVVAYSVAGNELAHLLAEGHYLAGIAGYLLAVFAICWAWINQTWFASAYDTDDWLCRVMTMVQMVGAVILALGLPAMFKSMDAGTVLDNRVMVLGYVIMRCAMIFQWVRVAKGDAERRKTATIYIKTLVIAQALWLVQIALNMPIGITLVLMIIPFVIELAGPFIAERHGGTPWHAHHIAERYGLMAIITLGEGILGTVASVSAIVTEQGWSIEAIGVAFVGVALTFSLWWIYFLVPSGEVLHHRRERSFFWGYGHMLVYASIAGMGAGLHVAGYYIEHKAHISALATVLCTVVPVVAYIIVMFVIYDRLVQSWEPFYAKLFAGAMLFAAASVLCAWAGLGVIISLMVLVLSPLVVVAGHEWKGHGMIASAVAKLHATSARRHS